MDLDAFLKDDPFWLALLQNPTSRVVTEQPNGCLPWLIPSIPGLQDHLHTAGMVVSSVKFTAACRSEYYTDMYRNLLCMIPDKQLLQPVPEHFARIAPSTIWPSLLRITSLYSKSWELSPEGLR